MNYEKYPPKATGLGYAEYQSADQPTPGLLHRLEELSKPLFEAVSVLEQIEDRLFGSRPRPAGNEVGQSQDGILPAVDRCQTVASELQGLALRIRDRL